MKSLLFMAQGANKTNNITTTTIDFCSTVKGKKTCKIFYLRSVSSIRASLAFRIYWLWATHE